MVVDGAVNGDVFEAFVEHVLVPELRTGDVVIMDNLSSHERQRIWMLIESAGADCDSCRRTVRTSTRSKMMFSKVKQALRSLACRTRAALWNAMQSVLGRVIAEDAINYFKHCGTVETR